MSLGQPPEFDGGHRGHRSDLLGIQPQGLHEDGLHCRSQDTRHRQGLLALPDGQQRAESVQGQLAGVWLPHEIAQSGQVGRREELGGIHILGLGEGVPDSGVPGDGEALGALGVR